MAPPLRIYGKPSPRACRSTLIHLTARMAQDRAPQVIDLILRSEVTLASLLTLVSLLTLRSLSVTLRSPNLTLESLPVIVESPHVTPASLRLQFQSVLMLQNTMRQR